MRDFLRFFQNSHFFFLFLFLETISIFLAVRNTEKKNIFINSANSVVGYFYDKTNNVRSYFLLKENNESLKKENEHLKNFQNNNSEIFLSTSKKIEGMGYFYKSADVIKNSIFKPNNIITLNKGEKDGITEDMAVISDDGIVGIVANVSKHYCSVVSLLNNKIQISAKIKRTNYFGSLKWDGGNYRFSTLYDIPDHTSLYKGDEIVTSGYSLIFPKDIIIGTVDNYTKQGSFYKIKVKLSQDFNNLNNVYIVDFIHKYEIEQLEDSTYLRYQFIKR